MPEQTDTDVVTKAFFQDENQQTNFYNEWAKKYEEDTSREGYNGPESTLEFCLKWLKPSDRIIDIGAGTGQLGYLLHQHGYNNMDAHDGSEEMLKLAKGKRVYTNFYCEFLEPELESSFPRDFYDGMIIVGSFGPCHLNPDHVPELLRTVKKGGRIIIGTRKQWLTYPGDQYKWNYALEQDFNKFEEEGKWRLLEKKFKSSYGTGVEGAYFIYEKI